METIFPRVEDLIYRIELREGHLLAKQASLEGDLDRFRYKLDETVATFYPLAHFATEAEARAILEPQLRTWEVDCSLRHGRDTMRFKFVTSYIQSKAPAPGVMNMRGVALITSSLRATLTLTHAKHPEPPPESFVVNECVAELAAHLLQAKEHPGSVLKDAYAMLTRLEMEFAGLPAAAKALNLSVGMLVEVKKLCTSRGMGAEVRKYGEKLQSAPLTAQEREWLLRVLELLVRRTGALAASAVPGPLVNLADMPLPTA